MRNKKGGAKAPPTYDEIAMNRRIKNFQFLKSMWREKIYTINTLFLVSDLVDAHIRSKLDTQKLEKNRETDKGNKKHVF